VRLYSEQRATTTLICTPFCRQLSRNLMFKIRIIYRSLPIRARHGCKKIFTLNSATFAPNCSSIFY